MNKNNSYIIKEIKTFDGNQFKKLFINQSNIDLKFIMFRVKQVAESNKKISIQLHSLLKNPLIFKMDLICSFNHKKYAVAGFDNEDDRKQSILMLQNSINFCHFKCYYPEGVLLKFNNNNKKVFDDDNINKNDMNECNKIDYNNDDQSLIYNDKQNDHFSQNRKFLKIFSLKMKLIQIIIKIIFLMTQ